MSSGEHWTYIRVPNFRRTAYNKANQFVSSYGRVMNNEGDITCATYDYVKVSVPTVGEDETAAGSSKTFPLHHIVCYTFNGGPPSDIHTTVDHINRKHYDNSKDNLRWATIEEQLNNREKYDTLLLYEGQEFQKVKPLSEASGKRLSVIRGMVKEGDESVFQILKRVRHDLPPVVPRKRPKPQHSQTHSLYKEAFAKFVYESLPSSKIAPELGLQPQTVVNYIVRAAREANNCDRIHFRNRIGLTKYEDCKRLAEAVQAFKSCNPTKHDWETRGRQIYIDFCQDAKPPLMLEEYRIVQGTYMTLY